MTGFCTRKHDSINFWLMIDTRVRLFIISVLDILHQKYNIMINVLSVNLFCNHFQKANILMIKCQLNLKIDLDTIIMFLTFWKNPFLGKIFPSFQAKARN